MITFQPLAALAPNRVNLVKDRNVAMEVCTKETHLVVEIKISSIERGRKPTLEGENRSQSVGSFQR